MVDIAFPDEPRRSIFNDSTPNILIVGLPKSGKTSMLQVIFQKASPHETLYLQPTTVPQLHRINNNPLMKLSILDCPGSHPFDDYDAQTLFSLTSCIIIVIDSQNEPFHADLHYAKEVMTKSFAINPSIFYEIVLHKHDRDIYALEENRLDCHREIHSLLLSSFPASSAPTINFHSTSIYDHSIFDAFSKIVQQLVPLVSTIELMLDLLVTNCRMEKVFLFDVVSKIFIATDSSPVDPSLCELCADSLDIVVELSCVYGTNTNTHSITDVLPEMNAPVNIINAPQEQTGNMDQNCNNSDSNISQANNATISHNSNVKSGDTPVNSTVPTPPPINTNPVTTAPLVSSPSLPSHSTSSVPPQTSHSSPTGPISPTPVSTTILEQKSNTPPVSLPQQEVIGTPTADSANQQQKNVMGMGSLPHYKSSSTSTPSGGTPTGSGATGVAKSEEKSAASCLIHLSNGLLLYLKELNPLLALVCIIRDDCFDRQNLIDYNINVFRKSLMELA